MNRLLLATIAGYQLSSPSSTETWENPSDLFRWPPARYPRVTCAPFEWKAELRFANGGVLLPKFDGEFASHASTYVGTGTVRYTW